MSATLVNSLRSATRIASASLRQQTQARQAFAAVAVVGRVRGFASSAPPHGGKLVDLMVKDEAEKAEIAKSADVVVEINERQSCDVELIVNGKLVSLRRFG